MSTRIVLATRNPAKVLELRRILTDAGLDVDLVGADAFAALPEVAETGTTFAANALIKARAAAAYTGLPAIADDSGLCVDSLNGMPGILSARWAGGHGDDEANLDLVLAQVAHVPDERRGAHFFCSAAVERVVEGQIDGALLRERRGSGGFGYDPIFEPYGESRTTAEMAPDEKDAISHRGQAFRALVPVLRALLARGGGADAAPAQSAAAVAPSASDST